MTTRASILSRAFGRIGIGQYEFDIEPDERAMARAELTAMLEEWGQNGVALGYVEPAEADNDAVDIQTPSWASGAIWNNLALRLAPEFGKTPSPQLTREARNGYNLAVGKTMDIPRQSSPGTTIRGAGDRFYRCFAW